MKRYTLLFAWDPQHNTLGGEQVHESYLEQIRLQLSGPIELALRKKGYTPDTYTFTVRACETRRKPFCAHFVLSGTVVDSQWDGGRRYVGEVRVNYREDSDAFERLANDAPGLNPSADISVRPVVLTGKIDLWNTPEQWRRNMEVGSDRFQKLLEKAVGVPLELRCGWPDVYIDVWFVDDPDKTAVKEVLGAFLTDYNRRHRDEPIHYIGEPQKRLNRVRVHVDFGGCEPTALKAALKAIGRAKLPIEKLSIR